MPDTLQVRPCKLAPSRPGWARSGIAGREPGRRTPAQRWQNQCMQLPHKVYTPGHSVADCRNGQRYLPSLKI